MTAQDLVVLKDICQVLAVFHHAQELLSSSRTPTLSFVIPTYDNLHEVLQAYLRTNMFPHLNYAICAAASKIAKYVEIVCQNETYGISMFLNPKAKKVGMEKHWPAADVEHCVEKLKAVMLAFLQQEHGDTAQHSDHSLASPISHSRIASHNLNHGFAGLEDLLENMLNISQPADSTVEVGQHSHATSPSVEEQSVADMHKVDVELSHYISDLRYPRNEPLDLVGWWSIHQSSYPLLWKVVRDVLPAQATSVPCERVFSSSKQTCTALRNSLDPGIVEKLQILKFGIRDIRN
jgi:hypothetical protein